MIFIEYIVVATIVVFCSVKAANYIDLLDKNTNLSGAFLGGVMLSAVTSLPEMFTSISATVLIKKPGLCIGNILGSDLFNLAALSVMILIFYKGFYKGRVARSYRFVCLSVLVMYVLVWTNSENILNVPILHFNITSIGIMICYGIGVKYLASANDAEADEDILEYEAELKTDLTVKQIVFRFIVVSILIVAFSIIITYITDDISMKYNLGQGLAGAIFLGVATSLPEVSSTIALFKMKNYDVAIGNIIGSNLFNFIILAVADFIYFGDGTEVYNMGDQQTYNLLIFGLISTVALWVMLKLKSRLTQVVCPLVIIGGYFAFLIL